MSEEPDEYLHLEGLLNLCQGLIDHAISDLKNINPDKKAYVNSLDWICYNGTNGRYELPFEFLCECLQIEPSYMRKRIFNESKIRKKLENQGVFDKLLNKNKEYEEIKSKFESH